MNVNPFCFQEFIQFILLRQENGGANELPTLTVLGQETANQPKMTTYETPISNLDFDVWICNHAICISVDLSIRVELSQNTGVQV